MTKQPGVRGPVGVVQFCLRWMLPPNGGTCSLTAPLDRDSFAVFPDSCPVIRARLENGLNVQTFTSHF